MNTTTAVMNPFALMTNPQAVFAAMERSERLARLHSRICRPLDKPLLGTAGGEQNAFDEAVDASPDIAAEAPVDGYGAE